MENKEIIGFKIGRGYNSITIWHFDEETHELVSTGRRTTNKNNKASRFEKYTRVVCETLLESGIKPPPYKPTTKERRKHKIWGLINVQSLS